MDEKYSGMDKKYHSGMHSKYGIGISAVGNKSRPSKGTNSSVQVCFLI